MNGHVVLAVLKSNWHTVQFDTLPADNEFLHGVGTIMTFDSLRFGWTLFAHSPT